MVLYRAILIFAIAIAVNCDCDSLNQYFQIKSQKSDLYAYAQRDEIGNIVTIEKWTNYSPQYWLLTPSAQIGCFNILNYQYEWALDVDVENANSTVMLAPLTDIPTQRWFINSEGTIMNAGLVNRTLDIFGGYYDMPGSLLAVYNRYDDDDFGNERFELVY